MAEWAYRTARFPEGITATDLANSSAEVQSETALWWFLSNLTRNEAEEATGEPHSDGTLFSDGTGYASSAPASSIDQDNFNATLVGVSAYNGGAPYGAGAYGVGPYGGTRLVRVPIDAGAALFQEFGDLLGEEVRRALAAQLGGGWDWIRPPAEFAPVDLGREGQGLVIAQMVGHLDAIAALVRSFDPSPSLIGHNWRPSDEAVSAEDKEAMLVAIEDARTDLAAGDVAGFETKWKVVLHGAQRFAAWMLKLSTMFVEGAVQEAGKGLGKVVPWVLLGTGLLSHAHDIATLLDALLRAR